MAARSFVQRVVTRFVSAETARKMEEETRRWRATCPVCGRSRDLWDIGGIRSKATGSKVIWGRCSGCDGAWRKVRIERTPET